MQRAYQLGLYGSHLFAGDPPLELMVGESEPAFLARLRAVKDPAAIGDLLERFFNQLHSSSIAINQAKARGDVAAVRALLPVFVIYRNRYAASGASSLSLSDFDKIILSAGRYIEQALEALPNAIAAAPKAIFEGLLKAIALPAGLAAGGFILYKVLEGQSRAQRA